MNKVELEARADALQDEINFLRAVYEAVCICNFKFKALNLNIELMPIIIHSLCIST